MEKQNIVYRKAEQSDIPHLVELRKLQLHDEGAEATCDITQSLSNFFTWNLANGAFVSWLAVIDDKVIATSGITFTEKPPYYNNPTGRIGILSNMYTAPEYRRCGIAKKLLELIVDEARERGYEVIQLTASDDGALLYENFGFERNSNFFQYKQD
ncbi:MAG: GNAT family N-acetyltransferase [Oscillospiraceae bacterium]|nr:GNAT family N-acetyltransferase [Oscillospiraceae bacterium]